MVLPWSWDVELIMVDAEMFFSEKKEVQELRGRVS